MKAKTRIDRRKILIFVDHYLPGYKHGGSVRSVANLVDRLSERFDFYVFTRDRDIGDTEPYTGIRLEQWIDSGTTKVFYSSDNSLQNAMRRIREVSPDGVYFNSFFSRLTIKVLLSRRLGIWQSGVPLLLAPRGEFSPGALQIKPLRKKLYILFVNAFGLMANVRLQASTHYEKDEIQASLKGTEGISAPLIARDLSGFKRNDLLRRETKKSGSLNLLFLSRISRKKNLIGALRLLVALPGEITFSICGPLDDHRYWEECQAVIRSLPANVTARYLGDVKPEQVAEVLSKNHLLLLPTLGENFGHVILESLVAGCPVLISDQTPWKGLEQRCAGIDLPLNRLDRFCEVLKRFVDMDDAEHQQWSNRTKEYGIECIQDEATLRENIAMFSSLVASNDAGRSISADID